MMLIVTVAMSTLVIGETSNILKPTQDERRISRKPVRKILDAPTDSIVVEELLLHLRHKRQFRLRQQRKLKIWAATNCSRRKTMKIWIENMFVMMFTESYFSESIPSENASVSV